MGQYYTPYLENKNKEIKIYLAHNFDNGLKLMEHSYINNNMLNQICNEILDNPCKIAWVGDYAEYEDLIDKRKLNKKDFKKIYNICNKDWHYENGIGTKEFNETPKEDLQNFDYKNTYLVNESAKCFIDLDKYIKDNTFDENWCIHPLSLLTAIGNGKGGGDYYGINKEEIGSWAFDTIYITRTKPKDYTEVFYTFKENF